MASTGELGWTWKSNGRQSRICPASCASTVSRGWMTERLSPSRRQPRCSDRIESYPDYHVFVATAEGSLVENLRPPSSWTTSHTWERPPPWSRTSAWMRTSAGRDRPCDDGIRHEDGGGAGLLQADALRATSPERARTTSIVHLASSSTGYEFSRDPRATAVGNVNTRLTGSELRKLALRESGSPRRYLALLSRAVRAGDAEASVDFAVLQQEGYRDERGRVLVRAQIRRRRREFFWRRRRRVPESAFHSLGYCFDVIGVGVRRNSQLAMRWYLRAWRNRGETAAANIATMYRDRGLLALARSPGGRKRHGGRCPRRGRGGRLQLPVRNRRSTERRAG